MTDADVNTQLESARTAARRLALLIDAVDQGLATAGFIPGDDNGLDTLPLAGLTAIADTSARTYRDILAVLGRHGQRIDEIVDVMDAVLARDRARTAARKQLPAHLPRHLSAVPDARDHVEQGPSPGSTGNQPPAGRLDPRGTRPRGRSPKPHGLRRPSTSPRTNAVGPGQREPGPTAAR